MRSSEVGVIPFHADEDIAYTYPVKVLEYMALGCVVVASDLPGIRTMIDHDVNGVLVPPGDADALAEALERVLADESMRTRLRAAGYERVRGFDARVKVRAVYSAIGELVAT